MGVHLVVSEQNRFAWNPFQYCLGGLYFESGGENNSELLLMLHGLTDNPRHKEKLLARYFEVAQPRSIMREYQRDKYSDILYSASFLELFNQKLRENREEKRLLDTDFIPVLLNEISDRADDGNGLMEVLKSFEELLETELRFRSR